MKKLFILLLFCLCTCFAFAQNADSVAYQAQRKKINDMLDQRRAKFGQYDQSLSMHTGIFGLQTKKDIRRSNDILMDIARTDDAIFRELKVLLEFRTFEKEQTQNHSSEVESTSRAYMLTIAKLQNQLESAKKEATAQQADQSNLIKILFIVIALLLLSVLMLLRRKRIFKA